MDLIFRHLDSCCWQKHHYCRLQVDAISIVREESGWRQERDLDYFRMHLFARLIQDRTLYILYRYRIPVRSHQMDGLETINVGYTNMYTKKMALFDEIMLRGGSSTAVISRKKSGLTCLANSIADDE